MESQMQELGHCSTCRKNGKTTSASNWCVDCKTHFCNKCLKVHLKVSNFQDHDITKLIGNKRRKLEEAFMCEEHDKKIEHFCRSCVKPVCTGCKHKRCKDVVTVKNMLPEVKGQLLKRQERLDEIAERYKTEISNFDVEVEKLQIKSASVKSDITKTIEDADTCLREKEAELLEKLDVQTDRQKEKLKSRMETAQTETQKYQQQSLFIEQALELEDEAQLFEMYLSPEAEAVADGARTQLEDGQVKADINFIHNEENLKEEITKMDVRSVGYMDETAAPQLLEVVDAKLDERDRCDLRDVVIMNISDVKVTVFVDYEDHRLKSFYDRGGESCSSVLHVDGYIWCLTVISDGKVAVTLHDVKRIITVAVTPGLELLSTIQTSKIYLGLSTLDQSTLVAGSASPPSVDLIDMEGNILKTFTTIPAIEQRFCSPRYIHATRHGTVLVSDMGLNSVICLTQSGDVVFTYTPTGERRLMCPYGITSTSTGDILVADWDTNKVIHLSESGEYIRDFLTAGDGFEHPFGLCFDEDKLCVTDWHKGLRKYKFGTQYNRTGPFAR